MHELFMDQWLLGVMNLLRCCAYAQSLKKCIGKTFTEAFLKGRFKTNPCPQHVNKCLPSFKAVHYHHHPLQSAMGRSMKPPFL